MKSKGYKMDYQERMSRVTAYIHDHLDDELDLLKLAEIACLSPYHWHRIYRAVNGETIAATVKRLRLHRAADYLVNGEMTVEKVAQKAGFRSLHSFTRVFRDVYGMPPAQYRKHGSHTQFQPEKQEFSAIMQDVTIKEVPASEYVAVDHVGSYLDIGKAFGVLAGWVGANGLFGPNVRTVGIFYDDPDSVPEEELRSRACFIVGKPVSAEPPIIAEKIPAGRYAVFRHEGPYADLKSSYGWLFGTWLVQSGEEVGDAPCFEEYLNDPRETPPTELLTDIYLPLK